MKSTASCSFHSFVFVAVACLATQAFGATIVFSDDFSGLSSADLHGTTPDVTTGGATWTASTDWKADGTAARVDGGGNDDSAFLTFAPTSGKVYTLMATLIQPTGNTSTSWAAIGFASTNTTTGSFYNNNTVAWMNYRAVAASSSTVSTFTGAGATGAATEGLFSGERTFTIVLDTTATDWTAEWFVGAASVRAHTYTGAPTINYVGLAREDGAGADFSSFSLSYVPEPSSALLGGLACLLLLRRRR